jgi:hypothetical protein
MRALFDAALEVVQAAGDEVARVPALKRWPRRAPS